MILNGLAVGCIYRLVALGFVLIYKATELVNFAQGDLLMLVHTPAEHHGDPVGDDHGLCLVVRT